MVKALLEISLRLRAPHTYAPSPYPIAFVTIGCSTSSYPRCLRCPKLSRGKGSDCEITPLVVHEPYFWFDAYLHVSWILQLSPFPEVDDRFGSVKK